MTLFLAEAHKYDDRHCTFLILHKSQEWILDFFLLLGFPPAFLLPITCMDVTMDRYDKGQLLNIFLKMGQKFTYYYYYYYNFTHFVSGWDFIELKILKNLGCN